MKRRIFDRQFKLNAIKLVLEEDFPVVYVAQELDIHGNSLYRWIRVYEDYGENAFPDHGTALYNARYEIKKLQHENYELRKELELLKKFRAFLKQKSV